MGDFTILRALLKESATLPLVEHYGKQKLELIEPMENYMVTIANVPADTIAIKIDKFPTPDALFSCSRGECRRADYAIVSTESKVIVFIELKRRKSSEREIIGQLSGAQCVISYCREIGKKFWNQSNFLDGYEYRFVSIGHIGIAKQPTRTKPTSQHDAPERMMKIAAPHYLQFKQML